MQPGIGDIVSMCSYPECMQKRRLAVRNQHKFNCKHLSIAKESNDANTVERCV